eukprot:s705_g3.t1
MANLAQFGADSVKALSWWRGIQSPMMIASILGLLFTLVFVTCMIPRHAHESEPDPEQPESSGHAESSAHADVTGEPSTEPPPSRYPMDDRSLGCKFPGVFTDPMFRCEGVLIWLYHRSELRIARDNKPILNTMRMNELSQMMHLCMDGVSPDDTENMKDSMLALSDLSDDETSPTHGASEDSVRTSIAQAYQAYQIGMNMFGHLRRPAQGSDDENAESTEERCNRYVQSDIYSVSDPAEWMAIHHGGEMEESDEESPEVRRRRCLFSERHEVSDGEQWDVWYRECMEENEQINNETFSETEARLDAEERSERNEHT